MSFYLDMSREELQRSTQRNPFEVELWLTLILRTVAEQGAADAIEEVFIAEDIFPANNEIQTLKSLCLLSLGSAREGHELLQQSLRRSPGDAHFQRILNEFLPAFSDLDEDLLLNPHAIRAHVESSDRESRFIERLESTIDLIETFNDNEGDPEMLLAPMERHVQNFPNDINAKLDLARLYHKTGLHPRARQLYRQVLDEDPICASAYFELATIETDLEEAIQLSETGLELHPTFVCGRYNYASLLFKAGMLEEGRSEMLRIPADSSFYVLGLEAIAGSLSQEGNFEQAIEFQEKVVALSVDCAEAWNCYGHFCAQLGEYEAALQHFDRVLEIDSEHPDGLYNRASMLNQLEHHDEAVLVLKYALTIKPHDQDLLTRLVGELQLCEQHQQAIELAKTAVRQHPGCGKLWQMLGSLHSFENDHADAIGCCRQALQLNADDFRALWCLARSQAHLGQREETLATLYRCIRLMPAQRAKILEEEAFQIFRNDQEFRALFDES